MCGQSEPQTSRCGATAASACMNGIASRSRPLERVMRSAPASFAHMCSCRISRSSAWNPGCAMPADASGSPMWSTTTRTRQRASTGSSASSVAPSANTCRGQPSGAHSLSESPTSFAGASL
jgi:hypothetical protein